MTADEPRDDPMIAARLTFDPTVPAWYCEVAGPGDLPGEALTQGVGPDPLSAAMNCAEMATAQWFAARWPDEQCRVITERGHERVTADGDHRRVRPDE